MGEVHRLSESTFVSQVLAAEDFAYVSAFSLSKDEDALSGTHGIIVADLAEPSSDMTNGVEGNICAASDNGDAKMVDGESEVFELSGKGGALQQHDPVASQHLSRELSRLASDLKSGVFGSSRRRTPTKTSAEMTGGAAPSPLEMGSAVSPVVVTRAGSKHARIIMREADCNYTFVALLCRKLVTLLPQLNPQQLQRKDPMW
jgi:hypothetical protein